MKWAIVLSMIALIVCNIQADVIRAEDAETVRAAIDEDQDGTLALLFIDRSLSQGSESGFWNGIVTSINHIFSGEDQANAQQQQIDSIEQDISDEVTLIQIDVGSNEGLREIQESYDVTTVPFLIVFKRGIVVLKEVPTHETHDKILQVLNVNPAAVHEDEGVQQVSVGSKTQVSSTVPEAISFEIPKKSVQLSTEVPESVTVGEPEILIDDSIVVEPEVVQQGPAIEPEEIVDEIIEEVRPLMPAPVISRESNQVLSKQVTLAPGDRRVKTVVEPPPLHVNPDDRPKYIHHQWRDVTANGEAAAGNWRASAAYISELEDYEIPEDWWRNGYSPIAEPKPAPVVTEPVVRPAPVATEPTLEPQVVQSVVDSIIHNRPNLKPVSKPVITVQPKANKTEASVSNITTTPVVATPVIAPPVEPVRPTVQVAHHNYAVAPHPVNVTASIARAPVVGGVHSTTSHYTNASHYTNSSHYQAKPTIRSVTDSTKVHNATNYRSSNSTKVVPPVHTIDHAHTHTHVQPQVMPTRFATVNKTVSSAAPIRSQRASVSPHHPTTNHTHVTSSISKPTTVTQPTVRSTSSTSAGYKATNFTASITPRASRAPTTVASKPSASVLSKPSASVLSKPSETVLSRPSATIPSKLSATVPSKLNSSLTTPKPKR